MRASRPQPEQEKHNVYRVDPKSGEIKVVVDDFVEPNGIAFSPDEKKLYIIDTGFTDGPQNPSHIRVFDVDVAVRKAVEQQSLCGNAQTQHYRRHALPTPTGRVWCSCGWGDRMQRQRAQLHAQGRLLGKIYDSGDGNKPVLGRKQQRNVSPPLRLGTSIRCGQTIRRAPFGMG